EEPSVISFELLSLSSFYALGRRGEPPRVARPRRHTSGIAGPSFTHYCMIGVYHNGEPTAAFGASATHGGVTSAPQRSQLRLLRQRIHLRAKSSARLFSSYCLKLRWTLLFTAEDKARVRDIEHFFGALIQK